MELFQQGVFGLYASIFVSGPADPCSLSKYEVTGDEELLSVKIDDPAICQLLCNIDEKCTVWSSDDKTCTTYSGNVKSVKSNKNYNSGASECGTDKDCAFQKTGVLTEETIDTVRNNP